MSGNGHARSRFSCYFIAFYLAVTNMNDAINHMSEVPDQGLVVLQPGETLSGRIHFKIDPL